MKERHFLSGLLTALGAVLAVATVCIALQALHGSPRILKPPVSAQARAEVMMNALAAGDFERAASVLYGAPSLGAAPENGTPGVEQLWDAYRSSLDYSFHGPCYATEAGVAVDVTVTGLDIGPVLQDLDDRSQTLLDQRLADARDSADLYDEENRLKQELIDEILQEAVRQSLEENRSSQERKLTLNMVFDRGAWWIIPDTALLDVLSGSFPEA